MPSHVALAAGPDPLLILFLALVLDAYVGDPPLVYRVIPHPLAVMGRLAAGLTRRLDRPQRSDATRRARGFLGAVVLMVLGLAGGAVLGAVFAAVPFGWLAEVAVVTTLVKQRQVYLSGRRIETALVAGGRVAGAEAVRAVLGRDPGRLDAHAVARRALEHVAEGLATGVVAAAFWYALLGLAGLIAFWMVRALALAAAEPHTPAFTAGAMRLGRAVSLPPAYLAGLMIAAAACFIPAGAPLRALTAMHRDAAGYRTPAAGFPVAAMAGALGVALGGPRRYGETVRVEPWVGTGRARATPGDIRRGLYVFAVACLIDAGIVAGLALARHAGGG